ncbi:hypothetical protein ACFFF5_13035 [Lederbergia wuyishanensis]|uniref:Uncharacterized protein n=1 Tax=Lederbergia wuyishanensis TaxID=1347903 RepID=A0ABU0D866_9BACI|nr:hypothetical protein [Lederbergia wuyishanensis]MCJ8009334.1 hypothetical protein [Lederbergia wuyishanensis]MDQ0344531.1 hypothetical protein [Lederbergia wuyishanensis]
MTLTAADTQNFEGIISQFAPQLVGEMGKAYVQPDIPEKKLQNALQSYGEGINATNVIALYDGTTFGSAKDGFLITKAGFYYKEILVKPTYINFNSITKVEKEEVAVPRKNKPDKINYTLHIEADERIIFAVNNLYVDGEQLYLFLQKVIESKDQNLIDETDKIMILEDMHEDVKLNYVKAIVQFVMNENDEVDAKSLSEIQTLMAQLNFDAELRHKIRSYVAEPSLTIDALLERMIVNIPRGSENALKISLVKDMIRVHRVRGTDTPALEVESIVNLAERYDIDENQIAVIEQGIKNDEKIMRGEVKDDQIVKNAKELSARAAAVGVPIAAIYMSGSVVGLSAAGLTSGLAALGLGGVLGLSSMVTGIGVVVIAGVGVYKGIQWLTGGSERSKTQKREFFIQEIIKNNQKTINNLAEDVNFFAEKVIEIALEQEVNKQRLEKLGKELAIFTKALKTLQEKGIDLQAVLEQKD